MADSNLEIAFDELCGRDKRRFFWGYLWRSLLAAIASAVGGAVAGAVIGFVTVVIAQANGKSLADVSLLIRLLSGTAGFIIGVIVLWHLIRWLFRVRWFGHRLRLVRDAV